VLELSEVVRFCQSSPLRSGRLYIDNINNINIIGMATPVKRRLFTGPDRARGTHATPL